MSSFYSIQKPAEGLYKEKGSRFLAFAIPVGTVDQAKEEIRSLRELHPKAVHVCFAWRIGVGQFEDRFSDDGEPNNSAGKPIFGQILSREITNVVIAVVRYYGGTKLGVGGLINAYKTAASDALDKASIVKKIEMLHGTVRFSPMLTGEVMSLLNKLNISIESHGFEGMDHLVKVAFPTSKATEIINTFEQYPNFKLETSD